MLGRYYRPEYRYSALYPSSPSNADLSCYKSPNYPRSDDTQPDNYLNNNHSDNIIDVKPDDNSPYGKRYNTRTNNNAHRGITSTEDHSNSTDHRPIELQPREKTTDIKTQADCSVRSVEHNIFLCSSCGSQHNSKRGLKIHMGKSSHCKSTAESHNPTTMPTSFLEALQNHKTNTKLTRRIPKSARQQAAIQYTSLIDRVVDQASNVDAWEKLALFSFQAFRLPTTPNVIKKSISSVIKSNLKSAEFPSSNPHQKWQAKSLKLVVEAKISEGDISGALRTLCSEDVLAPQDETTLKILQEKHPLAPNNFSFNVPVPSNIAGFSPSSIDIEKAINSFPIGSAGGLDGLRPQHLKDMISKSNGETRVKLLRSIAALISVLLSGNVPESVCPWFYGASLTALKKKDGGIRPIAVGNVLRRLTAKLACQYVQSTANDIFQPIQLGCGTRGGAEAAIHGIRHHMSSPRSQEILVKLDFKNAFNSIDRGSLLKEVFDKLPNLYPFIYQCYRHTTQLSFGRKTINSEWGVQQGDPLGPLCFCLVAHTLASTLKSKINIWYMDDVTLVDTPSIVLEDIKQVLRMGPKIGLVLNPEKSELYSFADNEALECLTPILPGAKLLDSEVSLLGSPLTDSAIPPILHSKIKQMKLLASRLSLLQSHFALYILQKCFGIPRLLYILRTCPTWKHIDILKEFDDIQKTSLESICNLAIPPNAWKQANLPVRLGGLGIRSAEALSIPAFLASAHSVSDLVSAILDGVDHTQDKLFFDAESLWTTQHSTTTPEKENKRRQSSWITPLDLKNQKELLSNATDHPTAARLLGVSSRESGSWLSALPSPSLGTFLDNDTVRIAIGLRLGTRLCIPYTCRCGSMVDPYGHHPLSCNDFGRRHRHSQLNDTVHRALTMAGVPSSLEPVGICRSDGKRPDGITLTAWSSGKMLLWDVTVSDTLATSYVIHSSKEAGYAANQAERRKKVKYAELMPSYAFTPIGMETLGTWGSEAKDFIHELGRRLNASSHDERSAAFLRQRIALDIQRGNAVCFKSCLPKSSILEDLLP